MNDLDYGYEDDGADWGQQENSEQRRWEERNNVEELLDNDPDYHKWADDLDRLAERDRDIIDMAEIASEYNNIGMTLEAWDRT